MNYMKEVAIYGCFCDVLICGQSLEIQQDASDTVTSAGYQVLACYFSVIIY